MRLKSVRPSRETSPREGLLREGLLRDQRGATMVMGVFIAALLVGMIYYVWGVGDAVMHRERMQDASDTAAFSAAVIHARGMNMLALLNMIMAALAIVAATMATIASMIGYAAAAAGLVCAGCGPWCGFCCSACPYAALHGIEYSTASSASDRVQNVVEGLMRGLHGYAVGIRYGVPLAAQAKVVAYGVDVYAPVTDGGVMAPPLRLQLPAQDDETNWPCDRKVLRWVRRLALTNVGAWGSPTPYMAAGVFLGEIEAAPRHAREWCDDGYFQRIPNNAQRMGNYEYQVQAYMFGSPDFEWTQQGVAVAAWGEGDSDGAEYTRMAALGRISFAQAEFFYDNDERNWREWLWHMNWRARLRRWRAEAVGVGGLLEVCGGLCGPISSAAGRINDVVVH